MLGLAASLAKGGASLLTYVKDNLKLYLDFKSNRSDTLAFPSEGSTYFITDDYIAVPDNDAFDFNESDVSITAWIKPTDLDTNYIILDKRVADEKGFYLMAHGSQNSPFFQISDGTNDYYAYSDDDLVAGAWNHIAVSFKVAGTGDATFYLNGVDAGIAYPQTANVGDTSNTAEVRIGKASDGYTASPFKGSIANLAVWSRALSQEEVQSVMNKSYSQLGSVEKTSLVSWWALDTNYTDSHSSNNGTNNGSTITTSVYGGNAPLLPRAIDIAESFADRIGNGSASFDGIDDYIDFGDINEMDGASQLTISAWMKRFASDDKVVVEKLTNNDDRVALHLGADGVIYYIISTGSGLAYGSVALTGTDWHHIVGVFDGSLSGNANRLKIYVNGVLQTLGFGGTIPATTPSSSASLLIGKDVANSQWATGNISQVGIWQGTLSQSQVQSLMESTSYAKIPADVKSTLGSELVDNNTSSGWFDNSDGSTISNITNGVSIADDSSWSDIAYLKDDGILTTNLTVGKVYKITFDAYKNLGGAFIKVNDGANNINVTITTINTTYTVYITSAHATSGSIRTGDNESGGIVYITNLSIKEVTNDLVAYYPLDADSSRGNVTDNVVTGETLGSNVLSNGDFASGSLSSWNAVSGGSAMSVVNNSLVHAVGTSGGVRQSVTLTSGALYKGSFDILEITTGNNGNTTIPITIYPYDGSSAIIASTEYSIGTNTFYFIPTDNGIWFEWGTGKGFTVDNFTLKKVTSNTGVLK